MALDTSNFSSDPAGGDAYKNYRRACQAAIKDINAVLAPAPKLNFMMPTSGMGEAIVATVGACVGKDEQQNPIWTNDKAGNGGKTRGIFAMREPADIAAAAEAAARGTFAAQLAARSKPKPAAKPAGRRRPF